MIPSIRTLILIALALGALWSAQPALEAGVEYQVVELNGTALTASADLRLPTIELDAKQGSVSGSAGVNRYGGPYTLKDGILTFGTLFSSMMASTEAAMRVERDFLALLAEPLRITEQDGRLVLRGAKGGLVLRRVAPVRP